MYQSNLRVCLLTEITHPEAAVRIEKAKGNPSESDVAGTLNSKFCPFFGVFSFITQSAFCA
jgi:hypothetical protein